MRRRSLIAATAIGTAGAWYATRRYLDQGIVNPCVHSGLPAPLAEHPAVAGLWDQLDPAQLWDSHVHLVGVGMGDTGAWADPRMQTLRHPWKYLQRRFYFNASCVETDSDDVDNDYVVRLVEQARAMAPGMANPKLMLMAFDWHRDDQGVPVYERSTFYMPHRRVRSVVNQYPRLFEWIASIHPYREDAVEALEIARREGARAVKWLPAAMGMDPRSPRCDAFYDALAALDMPLIVHGGEEQAVDGAEYQELCNPLRLRRPLERGVRVIVAHAASLGSAMDFDHGDRPELAITLFERLMDEQAHVGRLFGDISAVTQRNRIKLAIPLLLRRTDWAGRILHATDYPLPGVMALFSLRWLVDAGFISAANAKVATRVHQHNALLFDLMVKRLLNDRGRHLSPEVFQTRHVFAPA